jgi:hypothetical protein
MKGDIWCCSFVQVQGRKHSIHGGAGYSCLRFGRRGNGQRIFGLLAGRREVERCEELREVDLLLVFFGDLANERFPRRERPLISLWLSLAARQSTQLERGDGQLVRPE